MELVLVVSMMAILMTVVVPLYNGAIDKAKVADAVGDIGEIALAIEKFDLNDNGSIPATLAQVGFGDMTDPWGNLYRFQRLSDCDQDNCVDANNSSTKARRDGSLKPINSFFDLYSMEKDGESRQSLTANESQDDVVWAIDGVFVGLASDYSPK